MSYTRQQLAACVRNELRIAGYVFPGGLPGKLAMFAGYAIEHLWLDVELPISVSAVNAALKQCDAYMGGQKAGIYSGRWFFAQQGWLGLTIWSARPLWDANYDGIAVVEADFVPYGGWTTPVVKQFRGTTDIGHVHQIDMDAA